MSVKTEISTVVLDFMDLFLDMSKYRIHTFHSPYVNLRIAILIKIYMELNEHISTTRLLILKKYVQNKSYTQVLKNSGCF